MPEYNLERGAAITLIPNPSPIAKSARWEKGVLVFADLIYNAAASFIAYSLLYEKVAEAHRDDYCYWMKKSQI